MLQPKKVKHRKMFKGRNRGKSHRGNRVSFGDFGLQSTAAGFLTAREIEAARQTMTRHIKRGGKVWIRLFPAKPVSKKPAETRMGKGKGPVDHWVAVVKPGRVLFEISGVPEDTAREALRLASSKLPVNTKVVSRQTV